MMKSIKHICTKTAQFANGPDTRVINIVMFQIRDSGMIFDRQMIR